MNHLLNKIQIFEKISNNSYKKIKKIAENYTIEQLKDLNPSYAKNEAKNIINFVTSSYDKMPDFVNQNNLQPLVQKLNNINELLNYQDNYKIIAPYLKQASNIIHALANKHDQSNKWAIDLHQQADYLSKIIDVIQNITSNQSSLNDEPINQNDDSIEQAISNLQNSI